MSMFICNLCAKFGVLMAVTMEFVAFWDVTPYTLVGWYQIFRWKSLFLHEFGVHSSETSVTICHTTRRHTS
jgi:hypothetical protein